MTKTIYVKLTLSDCQYEALQAICRLEADSIDEYCKCATLSILSAHIDAFISHETPRKKELERNAKGRPILQ